MNRGQCVLNLKFGNCEKLKLIFSAVWEGLKIFKIFRLICARQHTTNVIPCMVSKGFFIAYIIIAEWTRARVSTHECVLVIMQTVSKCKLFIRETESSAKETENLIIWQTLLKGLKFNRYKWERKWRLICCEVFVLEHQKGTQLILIDLNSECNVFINISTFSTCPNLD